MTSSTTGWFSAADCSVDDFAAIVDQQTDLPTIRTPTPSSATCWCTARSSAPRSATPDGRVAVQTELVRALTDGPGIVVFKQAFGDLSVIDRATDAFFAQIAAEKAAGIAGRGPLRQARRERPGLGRTGQAGRRRARPCSPTTTPTTSSR